jgi:hypothetical protein
MRVTRSPPIFCWSDLTRTLVWEGGAIMTTTRTRAMARIFSLGRWYGIAASCITFASVMTIYQSMTGRSLGKLLDEAAFQYMTILRALFYPISSIITLDDIDRLFASIGFIFYAIFIRTILMLRSDNNDEYKEILYIVIYCSIIAIPFPLYGGYVIENGVVRSYHLDEYISLLPAVGALYSVVCLVFHALVPIIGKWDASLLEEIGIRLKVIFWLAINATCAIAAIIAATILSV